MSRESKPQLESQADAQRDRATEGASTPARSAGKTSAGWMVYGTIWAVLTSACLGYLGAMLAAPANVRASIAALLNSDSAPVVVAAAPREATRVRPSRPELQSGPSAVPPASPEPSEAAPAAEATPATEAKVPDAGAVNPITTGSLPKPEGAQDVGRVRKVKTIVITRRPGPAPAGKSAAPAPVTATAPPLPLRTPRPKPTPTRIAGATVINGPGATATDARPVGTPKVRVAAPTKPAAVNPNPKKVASAPISFGVAEVHVAKPATGIGLSSGPSVASLRLSWEYLRNEHASILAGLHPRFALRRDTGAGGPVYRLIAGPVESRAEAEQICRLLRAKSVACAASDFVGQPLTLAAGN